MTRILLVAAIFLVLVSVVVGILAVEAEDEARDEARRISERAVAEAAERGYVWTKPAETIIAKINRIPVPSE